MDFGAVAASAMLVLLVATVYRARRRHGGRLRPGPGAMGSVYDLLNEDRRNAIEIIVEQKAEARDPEDADGNLPELQNPRKTS